jgi:hypothetical protein
MKTDEERNAMKNNRKTEGALAHHQTQRLVAREVLGNASLFVRSLVPIGGNVLYPEDARADEAAGRQAIQEADLDQLETMADSVAYWGDILALIGYDEERPYAEQLRGLQLERDRLDALDPVDLQDDLDLAQLQLRPTALEESPLETWLGEVDDRRSRLESAIQETIGDWAEFCRDNDIDTDEFRREIHEHWMVTDWLGRQLEAKGEMIGRLCNLTIWGRCTTGQRLCMDAVIQQIAAEHSPEEGP